MNKKSNNTKLAKNSKIYVVQGYYDERGQYHEAYFKNFALKKLPEDIHNDMLENLNKGCDITALIFPLFRSIFVLIQKERKNKFVRHIGEGIVRELLDSELASSFPKTQIVWIGYNFSED